MIGTDLPGATSRFFLDERPRGRLKERCHGIGQHHRLDLTMDETGSKMTKLAWERLPINGTQLTTGWGWDEYHPVANLTSAPPGGVRKLSTAVSMTPM
ncbi:MAG: hypothetical protein AB1634_17185 [Thermodesulfobacteriota bacterium]